MIIYEQMRIWINGLPISTKRWCTKENRPVNSHRPVVDVWSGELSVDHGFPRKGQQIARRDLDEVPVFVSADDAGFISGKEIKNRQIPVQIARVLGFDKSQFPAQK